MTFHKLFLIGLFFGSSFFGYAQKNIPALPINPYLNWYNLDFLKDHVLGISTEKAYSELLKNRKWVPVIVAVIDGGTDSSHEDLKGVLWTNHLEIKGNGKDDDKNGYSDDVHGWNFIGGPGGQDVTKDNFEVTRILKELEPLYLLKSRNSLRGQEQKNYDTYLKVKQEFMKQRFQSQEEVNHLIPRIEVFEDINRLIKKTFQVKTVDTNFLKNAHSNNFYTQEALTLSGQMLKMGYPNLDTIIGILHEALTHSQDKLKYGLDTTFNSRLLVGDQYNNPKQLDYGNADFMGPDALHGTHVSGIIAAIRNNGKGINGIADHVFIMPIRAIPDGDERDKDVAAAVLYAVNNGAKIINMSFGKGYSPMKQVVDEAVRYAEKKGVLIIHAAGNESVNKDSIINYPNPNYLNGDIAKNWIEVGASTRDSGKNMVAEFSNYGKKSVDVFAPGQNIYSTVPLKNQYRIEGGTSMACPMISGMAAVLKSYFPKLTPVQIKEIIIKSATPFTTLVIRPGSKNIIVPFNTLSISGGIANLYQAVKLALKYP